MPRALLVLVGLCFALNGLAMTNEELLKNLSSRFQEMPEGKGTLIKSFTDHSQSFIYDQALAIIAFTKDKDQDKARKLLHGLKSLQMHDGSLYFSYFTDGTSPYPQEGDKRISGAMAWVALSAVHYQHQFNSKEFLPFTYNLLQYLESQMKTLTVDSHSLKALAFAPNDVSSTPFPENDIAALEHNLDAYSAFVHFNKLNPKSKWKETEKNLKEFIMAMWDKDRSHFWSGATFSNGIINKSELYLDNQTWSLLALDQSTILELSPRKALKLNCEEFFVKHEGVSGFMDSKPSRSPAQYEFVWSEGTLGHVLAMNKISKIKKETVFCQEHSSQDLLGSIKKMKREDGGIGYATNTEKKDFTSSSSVAGTAWMYFASNDFNPFHIEGLN